ncbi:RHS repeat-associated core domain-containing protein [Anaerofustis stercorihominis]|uniref:RHS repeat-associated core domain protein n=1 Tax=Anaerofustis stercorihominis DSM 17244 TaxID=445971 RepID=B1C8L7_9FIRM|nr:RHS repeat-associated core domain-containing protein [Anaerofustis stercorihominis]EDS71927.1 RHS repeat-associated core domain protein [Anaerofustis stercorihominis DSM 17244]MCQ4796040.1 RHS repeat-associated core domain-containing protein [Anaerofustis stercorihominis]
MTSAPKLAVRDYHYDGGNLLYTTDSQMNDIKVSENILNIDGNVISSARLNNNQVKYYSYNKDTRNSTSTLVGDDNVGIVAYKYDEFGETEKLGNATFENEICYTGQVYDKETGDYYYNARYYSPEDGRFVTVDTYRGELEEPLSLHLYAYCANNPINFTDPSGHFAISVGIPATGIVISLKGFVTSVVIGGSIAVGKKVYDSFKYNRGNKYKVKLEIDKPKGINGKTGFAAMAEHWKNIKGSTKTKLKKFLPRKYHYRRYHLHARITKNGKTIKRILII